MDTYIDGVNLAINFKVDPALLKKTEGKWLECKTCGNVFNLGLNFTAPDLPGVPTQCADQNSCNLVQS